jgi:hypothetical protein
MALTPSTLPVMQSPVILTTPGQPAQPMGPWGCHTGFGARPGPYGQAQSAQQGPQLQAQPVQPRGQWRHHTMVGGDSPSTCMGGFRHGWPHRGWGGGWGGPDRAQPLPPPPGVPIGGNAAQPVDGEGAATH